MSSESREERFRQAYTSHARTILGYALRRTSPSDAADVVAETMTVAWRRIDDMPPEPETLLWLYGVARNVVSNNHRSRRRQDRLAERLRSEVVEQIEEIVLEDSDPVLGRLVHEALSTLSETGREILTLAAAEQLSPAEISTILGMNQNTVRTHLHRARTKIRRILEENVRSDIDGTDAKRTGPTGHDNAERSSLRFPRNRRSTVMNDEELDRLLAASMLKNSDVHALDLTSGEAELMENIMTITQERPDRALRIAPVRRRRKVVVGAAIATLAIGGAVAATGLFPEDNNLLPIGQCRTEDSIQEAVATLQRENGNTLTLYTTRASGDAPINGDVLVETLPDGRTSIGAGACNPPGVELGDRGDLWLANHR